MKKILMLSTRDAGGGASEWFYDLALALYKNNFEIYFVVKEKLKNEPFIIQYNESKKKKSLPIRILVKLLKKFKNQKEEFNTKPEFAFFPGENEDEIYSDSNIILATIPFIPEIIITGLTYGFINSQTLRVLKETTHARIFMTAYDMYVFTGGCHVSFDCLQFKNACSNCPGILSKNKEIANKNFLQKLENIGIAEIGVMYGSPRSHNLSHDSVLFKNNPKIFIGHGLDTNLFNEKNREIAKTVFGFDPKNKIIMSGADNINDTRKGYYYFVKALDKLWEIANEEIKAQVVVMIIGRHNNNEEIENKIRFQTKFVEFITDYRLLSLAYQASDIFASPSIDDMGPGMVLQALACGTPVVGFDTGYLLDDSLVKNYCNGYRAKSKDIDDFANGLYYFLNLNEIEYKEASTKGRTAVERQYSSTSFINIMKNL